MGTGLGAVGANRSPTLQPPGSNAYLHLQLVAPASGLEECEIGAEGRGPRQYPLCISRLGCPSPGRIPYTSAPCRAWLCGGGGSRTDLRPAKLSRHSHSPAFPPVPCGDPRISGMGDQGGIPAVEEVGQENWDRDAKSRRGRWHGEHWMVKGILA